MTDSALRWPTTSPRFGSVSLREFYDSDVTMVQELATDPYVPLIGSLPAGADVAAALAWIGRQRTRLPEGIGFSFCIADDLSRPLGFAGLWTRGLPGGRATAGYAVAPSARGHGVATDALKALTTFAWILPGLHRVELYVEPDNTASRRTAEGAGYVFEGILRQHQEISGRRCDMSIYAALRTDRVSVDGSRRPATGAGPRPSPPRGP